MSFPGGFPNHRSIPDWLAYTAAFIGISAGLLAIGRYLYSNRHALSHLMSEKAAFTGLFIMSSALTAGTLIVMALATTVSPGFVLIMMPIEAGLVLSTAHWRFDLRRVFATPKS